MIRKESSVKIQRPARIALMTYTLAVAGVLSVSPAMALSGGLDPQSGLSTFAPYLLAVCEMGLVLVCMYKGVEAYTHGRNYGGAIIGFIIGTLLTVGGYYIMQHLGVSASL